MEYRANRKRDNDGILHQDRAVMALLLLALNGWGGSPMLLQARSERTV